MILIVLLTNVCFAEDATFRQRLAQKLTIDGYLRAYYFTRDYTNPAKTDQASVSFGGGLNIKTLPIYHMTAEISYYAADDFGLNSNNFNKIDSTLPGQSVNVLGQTYLQYQDKLWLLRLGNQIIDTPWLNQADARMIPATYQAIYMAITPRTDFDFMVFRQFRYKSRTSREFNRTNLYDPENFGGTSYEGLSDESVPGTFSSGARFKTVDLLTQIWFYRFYDLANLIYTDGSYTFKNSKNINPKIGAQFAREWGDGSNVLKTINLGKTYARAWGGFFGVEIPEGLVALDYNTILKSPGAYQNGDIVSPYTSGYAADPLYTTSMMGGLIEKAAGHAAKASVSYYLLDKQLFVFISYAKYYTAPSVNNTNEADVDITYRFANSILKGLSVRNRFGVLNGTPAWGRFIYNRIMIQYDF